LKQGVTKLPRLTLNSEPSYLSLISVGITGVCHHTWLFHQFLKTISNYMCDEAVFMHLTKNTHDSQNEERNVC
jgi:hypothetical protein